MIHRESIPGFRRGSWLPCYQAQLRTADSYGVSDERIHFAQRIDERAFSRSRRGYDKAEVKTYLEDLEQAFGGEFKGPEDFDADEHKHDEDEDDDKDGGHSGGS
mgnify:CR=1 FL=1